MTRVRARTWIGWFCLHFFFILAVSLHDLADALAEGVALSSPALQPVWSKAEVVTSALLGQECDPANPFHRGVATYLHAAGIEAGYGYFAPNVPDSYVLLFELGDQDGKKTFAGAPTNSAGASLRLTTLLEKLAQPESQAIRGYVAEVLGRSVAREHPDAVLVRAIFSAVTWPDATEYERGAKPSYQPVWVHEFSPNR